MIDAQASFEASLGHEGPPALATPLLRAVWYGLRGRDGDWDAAHELAQTQDGVEGNWVHAWLHRIEGDVGNADYWCRRAELLPRRDSTREEGLAIVQVLLKAP